MTLDEAIEHAEEVAIEQDKLCKRYDDASGYSRSHNEAIRTTDAKRCEECAEEHRQLAEWLKELKQLKEQPRWVPVKFRPLTEEEQREYPDYCYMADCQMPDDGEEILVSTVYGTVEKDECRIDDGFYLDSGYDWQTDIVAWMPLPQPYKAESEG